MPEITGPGGAFVSVRGEVGAGMRAGRREAADLTLGVGAGLAREDIVSGKWRGCGGRVTSAIVRRVSREPGTPTCSVN